MTLKNSPPNSIATLLLAHGAGAGMDSDFMQQMAEGLAEQGIQVVRFDFDYMQKAKQLNKKRPPDRLEKLQACFKQHISELDDKRPLFIGGKSMGGRIASTLVDNAPALGAICLGYPFHPPGKPDKLRVEHLKNLHKPMLIVQGERDTFGKQAEVSGYELADSIQVHYLPDGEHSFKPRKSAGIQHSDNMQKAIDMAANFIKERL